MKRRHCLITIHMVWEGRHTNGMMCIGEYTTDDMVMVICGPDGRKLRPLSVDVKDFHTAIFRAFPGEVVIELDEGKVTISQLTGEIGELWFDSGKHARAKILAMTMVNQEGWEEKIPAQFVPAVQAVVAAAKGDTTRPIWAAKELYEIK